MQWLNRLLLLLVLLVPGQAWAAVAFDAASECTQNTGTSMTCTHNASGSNRAAYCVISHENGSTDVDAVSATYNSVAMDVLFTDTATNASRHIRAFRLVAPDTGSQSVVFSWGGTNRAFSAICASFTGVDQADPDDAHSVTAQPEGTTVSTTVSSATGDMVMDAVVAGSGLTMSVNNGNTEINQIFVGQTANGIGASYEAGAASTETGWLSGSTAVLIHWAWNINAASEGGGAETFGFRLRLLQ